LRTILILIEEKWLMLLEIFHQAERRVFRGERRAGSAFGHMFGGASDYVGPSTSGKQPPVHLLLRLDMNDQSVGVTMPGIRWLPLLCAIRYGACDLGYRVVSDTEVAILHRREKRAWDGFPYDGYPEKLPPEPIDISEVQYDPANPRNALSYAGVFGYDALSPGQFEELARFVVREGIYHPEISECETPEEFLEDNCWPFQQGKPEDVCPNASCANHRRPGALRPFAIFREERARVRGLWGPDCGSLQIIYQVCPACGAIRTGNQCD
jgi:hypothetical protein